MSYSTSSSSQTNRRVVKSGQADGWQALSPTVALQISVSRFFSCRWAQINVVGTYWEAQGLLGEDHRCAAAQIQSASRARLVYGNLEISARTQISDRVALVAVCERFYQSRHLMQAHLKLHGP